MLSRIDDSGMENLLNYNEIRPGKDYEKVAYVKKAVIKYTREDKRPYLLVDLRDCNSSKILGFWFDFDKVSANGLDVSVFNRAASEICFHLGDEGNLIITNIKQYQGSFPIERFIGKIENAVELLDKTNKFIVQNIGEQYQLPSRFTSSSYTEICNGRAGGLAKLSYCALSGLNEFKDIPDIDIHILYKVFSICMKTYDSFLLSFGDLEVRLRKDLFKFLQNEVVDEDETIESIAFEVCLALTGLEFTEHVFAHLIYQKIKTSQELLNIAFDYAKMTELTVIKVGETRLARY
jgi:hypothetical protein